MGLAEWPKVLDEIKEFFRKASEDPVWSGHPEFEDIRRAILEGDGSHSAVVSAFVRDFDSIALLGDEERMERFRAFLRSGDFIHNSLSDLRLQG